MAFDVDGTLTPGRLIFGPDGEVYKAFHVRDGMAFALAHRMGYKVGVITGRSSEIVSRRMEELKADFIEMNVSDKVAVLDSVRRRFGLSWEETAFMGDDLNDLPLFSRCGYAGCPSDGCGENREAADFLSSCAGGEGAAREFIETILKQQGRWQEAVSYFMNLSR